MRCADDRGQALVEFSLVVVLFLMFLGGLVDLGRTASVYYMLTNAAREGARAGVMGKDDAHITSVVANAIRTINAADLAVEVLPPAAERYKGIPLEVRVSYNVDLIMPFTSAFLPDPLPLTASTVMRVE